MSALAVFQLSVECCTVVLQPAIVCLGTYDAIVVSYILLGFDMVFIVLLLSSVPWMSINGPTSQSCLWHCMKATLAWVLHARIWSSCFIKDKACGFFGRKNDIAILLLHFQMTVCAASPYP